MEVREVVLVRSFRGSKSRNKVSVGEPAEGSLPMMHVCICVHMCAYVCICVHMCALWLAGLAIVSQSCHHL